MIYYVQNRGIMSLGNPLWYVIWIGKPIAATGLSIPVAMYSYRQRQQPAA